jgi:MYXO-CTERM domain-containing protein
VIGLVQAGIDTWADNKMGTSFERGGGGNGGGLLFWYAFAATMLNSQEMLTDLAAVKAGDFFETSSYYRGTSINGAPGAALWGQLAQGTEQNYWDNLGEDPAVQDYRTIRDPYGYIDGGGIPGTSYQENTSKPTVYTTLIMQVMPALAHNWPLNADVMIEYGRRWMTHRAHAVPDPCAPKAGTYGVNFGPDGRGSCIKGAGRLPQYDGTSAGISDRAQGFGEQMWTAYEACAATCTCAGQVCTAPGTPVPGSGGGATNDPPGSDPASHDGGGCSTAGAPPAAVTGLVLLGALGIAGRRRRRRGPAR